MAFPFSPDIPELRARYTEGYATRLPFSLIHNFWLYLAGTGKSQLSKYERSKELPKLDSLEKILKALGVGYFEFFCTLQSVDARAASMEAGPSMPALPILQGAYGSILDPATQTAFQTVFADCLKLHRHVVEQVLLGRLDERTSRAGHHPEVDMKDWSEEETCE